MGLIQRFRNVNIVLIFNTWFIVLATEFSKQTIKRWRKWSKDYRA